LALPKREAETEHWQIAMEQLIDAAEGRNLSGCDESHIRRGCVLDESFARRLSSIMSVMLGPAHSQPI
jgi:hypothetical protein